MLGKSPWRQLLGWLLPGLLALGPSCLRSRGEVDGGSNLEGVDAGSTSCGFNLVWSGDHCEATSCAIGPDGVLCALPAGGFGTCYAERCQSSVDFSSDPNNCAWHGYECPRGTECKGGVCTDSLGNWAPCNADPCPAGETCIDQLWGGGTHNTFCVRASCNPEVLGQACLFAGQSDYATIGICCGTSCVLLGTDGSHCGGCGVVCGPGEFCEHSTYPASCRPNVDCANANEGAECPLREGSAGSCCHGSCVDVSHDPLNCWACGIGCSLGYDCVSVVPSTSDLYQYCGAPPLSDGGPLPRCNEPGGGCPSGRSCVWFYGDYRCQATPCSSASEGDPCGDDPGYPSLLFSPYASIRVPICCSSACTDVRFDDRNCGDCGVACVPGTFCRGGICTPAVDCASLKNDQPCDFADQRVGACCDGKCIDVLSDPKHCSSCEVSCPKGATCQVETFGAYVACSTADGGLADCTTLGCDPGWGCVSGWGCLTLTCGLASEVGVNCAFGGDGGYLFGWCCQGSCDAPGPPCDISPESACQGVEDGVPCGPWRDAGFANGVQTSVRGICCSESCVDPRTPSNCGGCGIQCDVCAAEACLPQGPTKDCGQSCGIGTICVQGYCSDSTCSSGLPWEVFCLAEDGHVGYCCSDRGCADLRNDPLNCGTCGTKCPSGQVCSGGVCS
jgi:Stigma-specific protein, Stig1